MAKQLTFENAMKQLENIVHELESEIFLWMILLKNLKKASNFQTIVQPNLMKQKKELQF